MLCHSDPCNAVRESGSLRYLTGFSVARLVSPGRSFFYSYFVFLAVCYSLSGNLTREACHVVPVAVV